MCSLSQPFSLMASSGEGGRWVYLLLNLRRGRGGGFRSEGSQRTVPKPGSVYTELLSFTQGGNLVFFLTAFLTALWFGFPQDQWQMLQPPLAHLRN